MAFASNPAFFAAAFIEASAAFILLILYWLLAAGSPARFFRYWIIGWTLYISLEGLHVLSLWRGSVAYDFAATLSFVSAALFFAAAVECVGKRAYLKHLWPVAFVAAMGTLSLGSLAKLPNAERWVGTFLTCSFYLAAGWLLWRSKSRHRGLGWNLLAGVFILRGLNGLDRPLWGMEAFGLFRASVQGLLGIAMGMAMAVLVLEASRMRTDDLNDKLRRLALITAEATQSFSVDKALDGILKRLVESLSTAHGFVFIFSDAKNTRSLDLIASVGFSDEYRKQYARISTGEIWVNKVLEYESPLVFDTATDSPREPWLQAENLHAAILVAIPGKNSPLGILGIGFSDPRSFDIDEKQFLVNAANLLGLTVQNITLFESAAASRRQWRDTFDSIDDLIFVHAPDGRVLRANRPFAAGVRVDPAALNGKYVHEILRHGSRAWTICPYCEGAEGKTEEIDSTFGGYFLATDSAFNDSEGEGFGTIHVLKDFTSRREAENKFRNLFEKAQEGVFIARTDGRLLDCNRAFMRILGYQNREELLKLNIFSELCLNPADQERLAHSLHQIGHVSDFEFQLRRRDGEIRTALQSSFLTHDGAGASGGVQGFLLDITDHKRAEMDIRRRNRELLALNAIAELLSQASTLDDGLPGALGKVRELFAADVSSVYLLDESSRTLRLAAASGYEERADRAPVPTEVSAVSIDRLSRSHATLFAEPSFPEQFRAFHKGQGVQVSPMVVLWSKDRIMGVLIVGCRHARDFSPAELSLLAAVGNQIATTIDKSLLLKATRGAYESLRQTQEQLLQSEKMAAIGQLISGVAHELNNPLTAILGYSQLLKSDEFSSGRGSAYVDKLYKQAQRTHRIVQSLLSFSRQHKPERTPVQLNQILDDTLTLREYDLKLNNITVHRQFDSHLPSTGGDFHQLQQVFLNILNNAVDAVNEKDGPREIWIRTERANNRVQVSVTDSGKGVKEPNRIFDPFYTTKPVGKGTGLGLSICYGIVKEHGGEIHVRNSAPRGATFEVVLPLVSLSQLPRAQQISRVHEHTTGRVLLVDDEESVLQLEQEILGGHGLEVKAARSTWEAIDILKSEVMDVAVIDLEMSGEISTLGLFNWIEQNHPELAPRVIFTTSNVLNHAANDIIRRFSCSLLMKPFQIDEFWNALRRVLASEVTIPLPH